MPAEFWRTYDAMRAAFADRHIGRVIRAYRTHPHHGRHPLSQEELAAWVGVTQSKLSRIETGPRIDHLDLLIHIARVLRIPAQYLWFTLPDDHQAALDTALRHIDHAEPAYPQPEQTLVTGEALGARSSARTKILLAAVQERANARVRYVPPAGAVDRVTEFLSSSSRVYVTKGSPGCGKTRLMYYLADALATEADFQMHSVDSWDTRYFNLAGEVLHYASILGGDDPPLTLEEVSISLRKQCLVVVDGIKTQEQLNDIGRQLDGILRHVTTEALKYLLVIRAPPDTDFSSFPVLAASIYEPRVQDRGESYRISPWRISEAQDMWNNSQGTDHSAFSDLPSSIQQLARVPLYMQLLKAAGHSVPPGEINAYRLVDYCVRSILDVSRQVGPGTEAAMEILADLAQGEALDLVPVQLAPHRAHESLVESWDANYRSAIQLLVRTSSNGRPSFDHDVIREYFLANRIANLMAERGLSVATVGAFNELAGLATTSAMARGVFDFVVHCLDRSVPDLVTTVALSPTISVSTTLPLMIKIAFEHAAFVTDEVVRICAGRCNQDSALELARSILVTARVVKALGDDYTSWIVDLLRRFGSGIWGDLVFAIERNLDARAANQLLASADLDNAEAAAFFARYFFLFFGDAEGLTGSLESLLAHPDWRVRAALAEGLRDEQLPHNIVAPIIMGRLVRDDDYKVRAAVAKAVGGASQADPERHLATLLPDDNWHVRESVLQGILTGDLDSASVKISRVPPSPC